MEALGRVVNEIVQLSTKNESDLKKLKDYLRNEQETLKAFASQIDQALTTLDPVQHTLGVAYLLSTQLAVTSFGDTEKTFEYVGIFLHGADEQQVQKAPLPFIKVCMHYSQMAIDAGQKSMLQSIIPLRCALEKARPNTETLTPVHTEFLRVCLKCKAYHLGAKALDHFIYDVSLSAQMTPVCFLCYFYYGALIHIGMKEFRKAMQLLLVVLTCPATSCLSQVQVDAYKKFALLSLIVHGALQSLPVYTSHIIQRYAKNAGYVIELANFFQQCQLGQKKRSQLKIIAEEKAAQIETDRNTGLVKQVLASLQRHQLTTLTKTYLTLSLDEIAKELSLPVNDASKAEVELLVFDMVSAGEINAKIDHVSGNVSFEDQADDMDVVFVDKLQARLLKVLELSQRIAAYEQEVVSSESYIRKSTIVEGGSVPGLAPAVFDFMDM